MRQVTGYKHRIFKEIATQTKRLEAVRNPILDVTSKMKVRAVLEFELIGRSATKKQMLDTAKRALSNMPWRMTSTVVFGKNNKPKSMVNVKLNSLRICK